MRMLLVISLAILAAVSFGCGGGETNSNANSSAVVVNANPADNSNVVALTPANGMPPASNANGFPNANQPNVSVVNAPPMTNAKPMTYPAPDNSDYQTTMDKTGSAIEIRTFHDNKYITKVTRTWKGVNDKSIQIYLKNGKVVNVPGDKLPEIRSLPVESFYTAAGITINQPASGGPPAPAKQQQTKPSN